MLNVTNWGKTSQAEVFVYMSLPVCTTQDNINWMHALKKQCTDPVGKNHSRWWMTKTTHNIYYWKVLIVCTCTVFVDWKSSSRGSCRGHREKCCCTHLFFLSHTHVPYSSTQHFCKIIRSPSYSNTTGPSVKRWWWRVETSLQIWSSQREDPLKHDSYIDQTFKSHCSTFQRMMSHSNQPWVIWPWTLTYNSRLYDCLLVIVHYMIKCNYVMLDRRG